MPTAIAKTRRQKPPAATPRAAKRKVRALPLTLHREPFDAIVAGKKKTEYREYTAYWRARLDGRSFAEVHFRNGYAAKAPFMRVECRGIRKINSYGRSQYAIRLGRVLQLKYYKSH